MESFVQPNTPNAGSGSHRPMQLHSEISATSTKRSWDLMDDSSSIVTSTSISSIGREMRDKHCKKCKDPSKATRPLFRCQKCKFSYHENCHKPIPNRFNFICSKCTNKIYATSVPASSSYTSPYSPLESKPASMTASKEVTRTLVASALCEIEGCRGLLFSTQTGSRPLCSQHLIDEKHKKAISRSIAKHARPEKQIDKRNLCHVRPADRELLDKSKKRKRCRITNDNQSSARVQASPKGPKGENSSNHTSALPCKPFVAKNHDRSNLISSNVEKASLQVSPVRIEQHIEANYPRSNSLRSSPPFEEIDSLGFCQPQPSLPTGYKSPWVEEEKEEDDSYSPGSQINHELLSQVKEPNNRASKRPTDESQVAKINLEDQEILAVLEEPFSSTDIPALVPIEDGAINSVKLALADQSTAEIPTSEFAGFSSELFGELFANPSSILVDETPEAENADDNMSESPRPFSFERNINHQETCLSVNKSNTSPEYDGSTLDSFLLQQTSNKNRELSIQELLISQHWGSIDPRAVWPKRLSPDEYDEKMHEISARGTRKQNFGKLLTPRVRQERAEKGWHIHQLGDRRKSGESKRMLGHLEELFGITKMDNFLPATRNGKLVMLEREMPEVVQTGPGRRRRKIAPRIFTVMGAP